MRGGDQGLSPRGRGKPVFCAPIIYIVAVYPRVGGGNTSGTSPNGQNQGLSPRGRGKQRQNSRGRCIAGSIPAWAGETGEFVVRIFAYAVYPRVGGGNGSVATETYRYPGLSPRGRGKRPDFVRALPRPGSIPAWAGETASGNRIA